MGEGTGKDQSWGVKESAKLNIAFISLFICKVLCRKGLGVRRGKRVKNV